MPAGPAAAREVLLPLAGRRPDSPSPARGRRWRAAPDEGTSAASWSCCFPVCQRQDQKLSRRDGASHLSLLVQRNLAQRNTPRLRARRCAPGPRSRRDFPRGHPAPAENAAHPCAAPCGSCPPAPPLRRGPESQGQQQRQQLRRSGGSREHVATRASVRRPDLRRNVFPVTGERLNQAAPRGGVGLNELSDLALAPQEVNDAATRAELLVVELGIATLAA